MSRPLRSVADVHYGKSPGEVLTEDSGIPVLGTGGAYGKASKLLFNGPAVVVPRKGSLGNPQFVSGPFWPSDTTYAVLPKPTVDAKWLYYSLDAYDLTKLNEATGVPSISRDWLYRVRVGDSDGPEQRRIAEILSTIDEAIEQTEALIAKTQQVKAGLMHDLFTRGVTPDGQLRPLWKEAPHLYKESSLGWIPREWSRSFLGAEARFASGFAFRNHQLAEEGIKVVRISNLHKPGFPFWRYNGRVYQDWIVEYGDLLFSWAGVASSINAHIYRGETAVLNQHIYNFHVHDQKRKLWIFHWLRFCLPKLREGIEGGAGQLHLTKSRIQQIELPIPRTPEMGAILARIEAISKQIALNQRFVSHKKMQKSGLMHDLLTGRVLVPVKSQREEGIP